jgi:hypothetical protein
MKQLLEGISNQHLSQFTVLLGSLMQAKKQAGKDQTFSLNELTNWTANMGQQPANFNSADMKVTDQVLKDAEQSTRQFAEARNRNAMPKSFVNASESEHKLIESVKAWTNDRKSHFRGTKRQKKSTE